ncbi:condensin-2 complex subunit D3 [Pycnococcus provasolii]
MDDDDATMEEAAPTQLQPTQPRTQMQVTQPAVAAAAPADAHVANVLASICQGDAQPAQGEVDAETKDALAALAADPRRDATANRLWARINAQHRCTPGAVATALLACVENAGARHEPTARDGLLWAAAYANLLRGTQCPALGLLNHALFEDVIHRACDALSKTAAATQDAQPDAEQLKTTATTVLRDVAHSLGQLPLRDQGYGLLRGVAEAFVAVLCIPNLSEQANEAACDGLTALMNEQRHGDASQTSAMVMRLLSPLVLGTFKPPVGCAAPSSRDRTSVRTAALTYVCDLACGFHEQATAAAGALAKHLLLRAMDRAEPRAVAASSAAEIAAALPALERAGLLRFTAKLSRSAQVAHRTTACEAAPGLFLACSEEALEGGGATAAPRTPAGQTPGSANAKEARAESDAAAALIAALVNRCSDTAPAVRAKALTGVAAVAQSLVHDAESARARAGADDYATPARVRTLLNLTASFALRSPGATPGVGGMTGASNGITPGSGLAQAAGMTPGKELKTPGRGSPDAMDADGISPASTAYTPTSPAEMQEQASASLLPLARKRATDAKFAVRRAAFGLLENLLALSRAAPSAEDRAVAAAACGDALVSLRKHGLALCTDALQRHPSPETARLWLSSALPLVDDVESSLQEKALGMVEEILIAALTDPQLVVQINGVADSDEKKAAALALRPSARAMPLLTALPLVGSSAVRHVGSALRMMHQRKRLKASTLARACQRVMDAAAADGELSKFAPAVEGAWILLHELSCVDGACVAWKFLEPAWIAAKSAQPQEGAALRRHALVVRTMANAATHLKAGEAERLAEAVHEPVAALHVTPTLIGSYVRVLDRISASSETRSDNPNIRWLTASRKWSIDAAEKCSKVLRTYCIPIVGGSAAASTAASGEPPPPESEVLSALALLGEASLVHPPSVPRDASTLVQAIAVPPGGHSDACPTHVSAHAWACLGKLCLTDERLAKSTAPLFAQCVSRSSGKVVSPPACRNNAAMALCDLCIKFTAVGDPYADVIARVLTRDPCMLVRRQVLKMLHGLLSKEFLKCRPNVYHSILFSVVDDDADIRAMASHVLSEIVRVSGSTIVANRFAETMLLLNSVDGAKDMSTVAASDVDQGGAVEALSGLDGQACRPGRRIIYTKLLECLTPEQKLALSARLCTDILGTLVCDGTSNLLGDANGTELVADVLHVISCPEMVGTLFKRGGRFTSAAAAAAAEDEMEMDGGAGEAAKKVIMAKLSKAYLSETAVPVLIELKSTMSARQHTLLGFLMETLRTLLTPFKGNLEDVVTEKQLVRELLNDMEASERRREMERLEKAAARRRAAANSPIDASGAAKTPAGGSDTAKKTPAAAFASMARLALSVPRTHVSALRTPGANATTPGRRLSFRRRSGGRKSMEAAHTPSAMAGVLAEKVQVVQLPSPDSPAPPVKQWAVEPPPPAFEGGGGGGGRG